MWHVVYCWILPTSIYKDTWKDAYLHVNIRWGCIEEIEEQKQNEKEEKQSTPELKTPQIKGFATSKTVEKGPKPVVFS